MTDGVPEKFPDDGDQAPDSRLLLRGIEDVGLNDNNMHPSNRWTANQAQDWYAQQPWPVGFNYIPSTAVNQLEMWQADTFDPETIDRELGWARDLGFNTARVFLHDLLWEHDQTAFVERVNHFLRIADRHGISIMFVTFDGVWDPFPKLGSQASPREHIHNSRWVQSPGAELLSDPTQHDRLADYVQGIIEHFRDDSRVLAWDLFNEPDNPHPAYAGKAPPDKSALAASLLRKAFTWARASTPEQPITAGVWLGQVRGSLSEINELMLTESDVITFHSYLDADRVERRIRDLQEYDRPILLTEFMSRSSGSTFETMLPLLKELKVGAYCWGLVAGKTQTNYPWDSWIRPYSAEPDPWFHDILRLDGTPYRDSEVTSIRRVIGG